MKKILEDGVVLLESIPFNISSVKAASELKIPSEGPDFRFFGAMVSDAAANGSPKAAYRQALPGEKTQNSVIIEGEKFQSRVLRVNLEKADRVFLYVVSCGRELESWSEQYSDPLHSYFADYIKNAALARAVEYFYSYIQAAYRIPKYSRMAPGSLQDWPLEQQALLFRALKAAPGAVGVDLTESFLMLPSKSVSGILFPSETSFESCMLCPREKCPNRRAPYDERLYLKKYSCPPAAREHPCAGRSSPPAM